MSQLQLKRLRFTKEADTWLKVLKSRTGITPNLLCRMGFCLSLGEPSDPEFVRSGEDSDREINRYTLLGEYDAAFVALLRQWMHSRGKNDDTLDRFDDAVDLATRILEAADVASVPLLPADAGGEEILDIAQCDATQVRAIEALVRAERFWHALPFLLVLGQHHLPAVDPDDARARLGVP